MASVIWFFARVKPCTHLTVPARFAAALFIETHVREDHIHLYGFATEAEQKWFKLLTNVQGVGAKVALALLSAFTPNELTQAIAAQDKAFLSKANGVGPKLAVAAGDGAER